MKIKDMLKFIMYFGGLLLFMSYLFFKTDIVPDMVPVFGFMDDAIAAIGLLFVVNWLIVKFKLGGKKK